MAHFAAFSCLLLLRYDSSLKALYRLVRSWLLVDFDRVIPPWALVLLTPSCLPMNYGIWIFWSFLMETPQYVCLFWIQVCHKKVGTWNMHPLFACGMMALAKRFDWFGRGCGLWYIQFLTSCKILQYAWFLTSLQETNNNYVCMPM